MSAIQAYISNKKVQKVLSTKPGQKGFSLIELVVVVAVLAVLSAIAIPSFTNISGKARATAAANTLATMAKECAAKIADTGVGANATFQIPALDGYRTASRAGFFMGGAEVAAGTANVQCSNTVSIEFRSDDLGQYPDFIYNTSTGAKTCNATANSAASTRGCTGGVW
tara:strand:+ start:1999 stop:2502 length:504 start_codon:yes stop_codon:yes gene_type:complete